MSNRSLIEINHDHWDAIKHDPDQFVRCLIRYLHSGSRETGKALEGFGVKVIGMRHHSENFIVEANAEGFPVWMLPAPPSPTPDAGGDRG